MEQVQSLSERIQALKVIAQSLQEGAAHTRLLPEVDQVLALPDELSTASVGEREAVARQVREYEQAFDRLGYTLLDQIMPTTGASPVFRIVQAADEFKARLKARVGRTVKTAQGEPLLLEPRHVEALTRYSLSIGTPPVTDAMQSLVARTLFGAEFAGLRGHLELLDCDRRTLSGLLDHLQALVEGSLHYATAAEERDFLSEAVQFINFEGASFLNRVVVTESRERVTHLIAHHVFDTVGPDEAAPVCVLDEVDKLDADLLAWMKAQPNHVFVAPVTRIPHTLLQAGGEAGWDSVLGRLLLLDVSARARRSNTTIVYTLFPHVARTLRDIQTSFAGRPANTQLGLRRILERFPAPALAQVRGALRGRLQAFEADGAFAASVEELRTRDWRRNDLFDALALAKLERMAAFLEEVAGGDDAALARLSDGLRESTARGWMRYFYGALPAERYPAAVLPGGGRGALRLVGEYHRGCVREAVAAFQRDELAACRARLDEIKAKLSIPAMSSDEIEAAVRQSELRALSPQQWSASEAAATKGAHFEKTLRYRLADAATRMTRRAGQGLEKAAFANAAGPAAAALKRTMKRAGLGALHGHLEAGVLDRLRGIDRKARALLAPAQEAVRLAQQVMEDVKGEVDPVAVGEIEAILQVVERSSFFPTLVLPELSWTYQDVFPERDFPRASTVRIGLNERHEMDPEALLEWIEDLRYLLRRFPEIFRLFCKSVLLVVNTPHNPTGVAWRRETVLRLLQIAALYDLAVCDDNSYHKLLTRQTKDREGDACLAQIYEEHREHLGAPVRIHTVGATTKALQGSGDRTGLLHSNVPACVDYAQRSASAPHLMSLYLTQLKLESGLAVKRYTKVLEKLAADLLDPTVAAPPWASLAALLEAEREALRAPDAPAAAFQCLLEGYEELLRLRERDATFADLSQALSLLVGRLKRLRLEVRLRDDVERRIAAVKAACAKALPGTELIEPEGAFYACVRLCPPGDERGVREFLQAVARHRKVDVTWAGAGFVRLSLGGRLAGDEAGYQRFGQALEAYLRLLKRYWDLFEASGRDLAGLDALFAPAAGDPLAPVLDDLSPLLALQGAAPKALPMPVAESERGIVYCIEEGRSVADKVFVEWGQCATVEELLASRTFRVVYRRLLKKAYRRLPALSDLSLERVENQYGPLACLAAYHDRQLIDDVFRQLLTAMYREWHGAGTLKVLLARLDAARHHEKVAALHGINGTLTDLVNELMHAFDLEDSAVDASGTFAIGCEELEGVRASGTLPEWLRRVIEGARFAGATAALDPKPSYVTGAAKRVADHRYGFTRRDRPAGSADERKPDLASFQRRLAEFARLADLSDYVCKAEQVGPFKMLVVIHKACFHLVADELRLFPQIEEVQQRDRLDSLRWDGVMLFGVPATVMGEGAKTGYVLDRRADGALLPVAWIAREDATDYVGFFKKTLLTLHNERVKAAGGLPIHGSMITLTFKNGLRKTLVFTADSGTGKSETITAMMEQSINAEGPAADLARVDVLSGDMLSLWRGEDGQVYGFGTETGDFLRLTDITESWKARFGDLLERGSYSNLDHPKNPRVTIPGICDARKLLAPTRVNGLFYIDNYTPVAASGGAVELSEDPHQLLRATLVRGLRKNKGTSGDQPSLRAGLEFAGETAVVTRFRHAIDELLDWTEKDVDGERRTCLGYRDGAKDVFVARDVVQGAFAGKSVRRGERTLTVSAVEYDVLRNLYWLRCGAERVLLDREVYDQVYEPLVSTFCGNPFVDPEGMSRVLETFARTMEEAKVHTGVVRTQLAREGHEFLGPAKASRDVVSFLLEDEEVNARFQRNKGKVQKAMDRTFSGVLQQGTNLPVELEGYNLLLLEAHESTHVAFQDLDGRPFTFSTPYYRPPAEEAASRRPFVPAIALPDMVEAIRDVCSNPDHALDLAQLEVDLWRYDRIQSWRSREELIFQVLLVNGIVTLGSSGRELARFPAEVLKAAAVADRIRAERASRAQ